MAVSLTSAAAAGERRGPGRDEIIGAIRSLKPGRSFCADVPISVDQFLELLGEDDHLELVNGTVYRPFDVSIAHEDLFGWLLVLMRLYVEAQGLGRIYGSRTKMRVSATSAREPDIAFVAAASLDRLRRLEIAGAADLVVEIVESSASRREAVVKQAQYEELGVPELWVVDIARRQLRHFVLDQGRYVELPIDPGGEVEPRGIPGLRLNVAWLFQGPDFPSSLDVANRLLGR